MTASVFPDPPHPTVHDAFVAAARAYANRPFLRILPETAGHYGIPAGDLRYGDALDAVEALRARYAAAGYGPGHRAGLLLENRPAFFLHWLALNGLGVSVVPIGPELRSAELQYLIGHSEISLAVVLHHRVTDLQAAADAVGAALAVITAEHEGAIPSPARPALTGLPSGLEAECALMYTSGTTGRPKGCVLTNRYYLQAGAWYLGLGGLCAIRPGEDVLVTPLPMHHMNAMAFSTLVMVMSGGCVVPLDRFHPRTWWDAVREADATIVHYLGVMPPMLMGAPASEADRAHRVRFGFGAGVDRKLHAAFEARFGFPLVEAWAMTETGAGGVVIAHEELRHVGTACFGRAPAELEVLLVDDAGKPVGADTNGELLVRAAGPDPRRGFFREYLKDPEATAEAWRDGWFHTGDVVRSDADGYLYFVDRKKNVIRRSGENIAAVEVESVLRQHPVVAQVAVAATPDPVRGDEVLACIVPNALVAAECREAIARDLVEHCLAQLAYFKAPGYVAFVEALPLTASQKIQRGELKALAATLPGQPHVVDTRALKRRSGPPATSQT